MKKHQLSTDKISTLPSSIIENILCLVPIQEAARTSVLSREWRYNWTRIPKLLFDEFKVPDDENRLSVLEQTFERPSQRRNMTRRCKVFYAIYQVLLLHQGPIHEFTLFINADDTCVESDQIITHLARNNALKKFSLDFTYLSSYKLPLSVFSLHQLTDLYLCNCDFDHHTTNGFGSLTSLSLLAVNISTKTLIRLVSNCPLLKSFTLLIEENNILDNSNSTIIDLLKCVPLIEHLTVSHFVFQCFVEAAGPREPPTSLVHLKYFHVEELCFTDRYALPFLVCLIRRSPKLEKIKLRLAPELEASYWKPVTDSYTLKDDSYILLKQLNELEIEDFANFKPELEFVKLILAKSPALKKVNILLDYQVSTDEEMLILGILLRLPRASPMVEIIVGR